MCALRLWLRWIRMRFEVGICLRTPTGRRRRITNVTITCTAHFRPATSRRHRQCTHSTQNLKSSTSAATGSCRAPPSAQRPRTAPRTTCASRAWPRTPTKDCTNRTLAGTPTPRTSTRAHAARSRARAVAPSSDIRCWTTRGPGATLAVRWTSTRPPWPCLRCPRTSPSATEVGIFEVFWLHGNRLMNKHIQNDQFLRFSYFQINYYQVGLFNNELYRQHNKVWKSINNTSLIEYKILQASMLNI